MSLKLLELHKLAHDRPTLVPAPAPLAHHERRGAPRYLAEVVEAWLGWQLEASGQNQLSRATILDFSESGALLVVDTIPPASSTAWLSIDRANSPLGVELYAVGATHTKTGPHLLRTAFATRCPYELFKLVVLGLRSENN